MGIIEKKSNSQAIADYILSRILRKPDGTHWKPEELARPEWLA